MAVGLGELNAGVGEASAGLGVQAGLRRWWEAARRQGLER